MIDPSNEMRVMHDASVDSAYEYYKKDFWGEENLKYAEPHYRLQKSARIIRRLARNQNASLLDIGCGPATLKRLLPPQIKYYGLDIAIHEPAPNLMEADLVETPIRFGAMRFDLILAQGFFEYVGEYQSQKFAEISELLNPDGTFLVTYVNFDHRVPTVYARYSNVQPFDQFRNDLSRRFHIRRLIPTSHNWAHSEPNRKVIRSVNMHMNFNVPYVSRKLAVQYFFVCSPRV